MTHNLMLSHFVAVLSALRAIAIYFASAGHFVSYTRCAMSGRLTCLHFFHW